MWGLLERTGGAFTYATDDAYIHLTIARNVAQHGTWGIVPGVYESASSSVAWTSLLVPFAWSDPIARFVPLVLNVAAAVWILWRISRIASVDRLADSLLGRVAIVLLPVTLGLVPMAIIGMEHLVQSAVVVELLLVVRGGVAVPDDASAGRSSERRFLLTVAGLTAIATLLRLETVLVVAGLGIAALWARPPGTGWIRRLSVGFAAGIGAVAALAVVAATNLVAGQYALPNSVLAKATASDAGLVPDWGSAARHLGSEWVLDLLVILLVVVVAASGTSRAARAPAIAMLVTFGLHVAYVDFGLLARYRAYLLIGGVVAVLVALTDSPLLEVRRDRRLLEWLLTLMVLGRVTMLPLMPLAADDIHTNQEQMGRLLGTYYANEAVSANDIGMVGYHHDGPLLDVLGLGSVDVLREMRADGFDREAATRLLEEHDVQALVVYDGAFDDLLPETWVKVERWCYPEDRVVLAAECVAWYAPPEGAERLREALGAWEDELSDRVATSRFDVSTG